MGNVPIAIIGASALFPGSSDATGFWRDILAGRDLIGEVPPSRWLVEDYYDPDPTAPDKTYAKRGAFLDTVDFDPLEFGVPPSAMQATDVSQLLALIVAQKVLDDAASGQFASLDREKMSVILGVTSAQQLLATMVGRMQRPIWLKGLRESGVPEDDAQRMCDRISQNFAPWQEATFPGLLGNVVAGRIASRFDLRGTNCVTDAACASSLSAVSMSVNELAIGHSDLVLTGGVDTMNDVFMFTCFSKTPALSRTGDCRPFSDASDGTMLGEGLGMLALKRLADAERDGDRIYAVIRAVGASSDGRSKSIYAPRAEGQALAIARAYERAGYGPETVELVEAHGTGTKAGDQAEFDGLNAVFSPANEQKRQWCALGSIKSQIGHTKAAAGAAGLFKAVMALHHKVLPPTIKVERPNPGLALETTPFYLNTQTRPWIRDASHPRRASVSSFGFGGSNFHVALEEYSGKGKRAFRLRSSPAELLLLSANSVEALRTACTEQRDSDASLAALARSSQHAFDAGAPYRASFVVATREELKDRCGELLAHLGTAPDRWLTTPGRGTAYRTGAREGGIGFLFPGQGSQYVGMTADLAMEIDEAREIWDRSAALAFDGASVSTCAFPRPEFSDEARAAQQARLTATEWAQPAIGVASAALLSVVQALGIRASIAAGHSFGELTALYAAGVFDFDDFVRLSRKRGELMRDAGGIPGGMMALPLSAAEVGARLNALGITDLVIANYNGPKQTVVSGSKDAIAALADGLRGSAIAGKALPVATAFHSPLVSGSRHPFLSHLEGITCRAPSFPVLSNAEATPYPDDPSAIRTTLAAQIAEPVRFVQQIEAMYARGVRTFIEIGPGAVLSDLTGQILDGRRHEAVPLDRKAKNGVRAFLSALGRLAAAGVAIDYSVLWQRYRSEETRAKKKQALTIPISGKNHDQLYPPAGGATALPKPNPPRSAPAETTATPSIEAQGDDAVNPTDAWLLAYQETQRQTAEAHAAYQRAMAETQLAYLRTVEASFAGLSAIAGGKAPEIHPPAPAMTVAAPIIMPPPAFVAQPAAPSPVTMSAPSAVVDVAAKPTGPSAVDVGQTLLQVVAEKTGYPAHAISVEMELEADLGIDSIKRVEILSALRERVPNLPEVETAKIASLRTLAQIAAFLEAATGAAPLDVTEHKHKESARDASTAVQRKVVRRVEAPPIGFAMSRIFDGRVTITDDGSGVASALCRQLEARGIDAVVGTPTAETRGVIFLGGLSRLTTIDSALAINRQAFACARTVGARLARDGGLWITVQDTGGDFALSGRDALAAWSSGVAALTRTAAIEWPKASVKAIDIERGTRSADQIASALAGELCQGGDTREVCLAADGRRWTLEDLACAATVCALPLDDNAVVVVTGGARGITAASIVGLGQKRRLRFALLGRSVLVDEPACVANVQGEAALKRTLIEQATREHKPVSPAEINAEVARLLAAREVRASLDALENAGCQARYFSVDVQDTRALSDVLQRVREAWGPLRGLIHGAGVLADKLIADKSDEQFDRVFDTKVIGLLALLEATAEDPLAMLVVFSSVAARAGNRGQCDYAMANEILGAVAAAERTKRKDCAVKSLAWGPWQGGMVTPALEAHFRDRGIALIAKDAGARAFVDEITDTTHVSVLLGADLGQADQPRHSERVCDLVLDHVAQPYLSSHRIAGTTVVPVALALEWMVRAAAVAHPGCVVSTIDKLKVLRGIKLPRFSEAYSQISVRAKERSNTSGSVLGLEISGDARTALYRASVTLLASSENAIKDEKPAVRPDRLAAAARLGATQQPLAVYDGRVLFHGPAFQGIRSIEDLSRMGGSATLCGARALGWPSEDFITDPALIDGGLQLAVLWFKQEFDAASLPMAVERVRFFRRGLVDEPVQCFVQGRKKQASGALCDIVWKTLDGEPIADMQGLALVERPHDKTEQIVAATSRELA